MDKRLTNSFENTITKEIQETRFKITNAGENLINLNIYLFMFIY